MTQNNHTLPHRKSTLKRLRPLLLGVFWCSQVLSAAEGQLNINTYTLSYPDGRSAPAEIYVQGPITSDITGRLAGEISRHGIKHGTIYLDSKGGDLHASMKLGEDIRELGLNTAIGSLGTGYGQPKSGSCESACVIAYAGGKYRFLEDGSHIGIHQFYSRTTGSQDLVLGQVVSAAVTGYLLRMGVSPHLFEKMVNAGAASRRLSPQDAAGFGLVNNGVLPSMWEIGGSGGAIYLAGHQETWNGVGRVRISCDMNRPLRFTAQFDAGLNTQFIQSVAQRFALRINGQFVPVALNPNTPTQIKQGFITSEFNLSKLQINELMNAWAIGFAWQPSEHNIFYGYEIATAQKTDTVSSFLTHCQEASSL